MPQGPQALKRVWLPGLPRGTEPLGLWGSGEHPASCRLNGSTRISGRRGPLRPARDGGGPATLVHGGPRDDAAAAATSPVFCPGTEL